MTCITSCVSLLISLNHDFNFVLVIHVRQKGNCVPLLISLYYDLLAILNVDAFGGVRHGTAEEVVE